MFKLPSSGSPGCVLAGVACFLAFVGILAVSRAVSALSEAGDTPEGLVWLAGFAGAGLVLAFVGLGWFLLKEGLDAGTVEGLHLVEATTNPAEYGKLTPKVSQVIALVMREVAAAPSHDEVVRLLAGRGKGDAALANPKLGPVAFAIRPSPLWRFAAGLAMEGGMWAAAVYFAPTLLFWLMQSLFAWPVGKEAVARAISLRRRAQQFRLRPQNVLRRETRDPILYLRAFSEDYGGDLVGVTQITSEERLTRSYARYGPVLTIGDPREKMPLLGAVRLYFDEATWRLGVLYLLSVSQLVIIQAGFAPGLLWELGVARRRVEPGRLIVSFAAWHGLEEGQLQVHYLRFKNYAEALLGCGLPPEMKTLSYIGFEPGWVPVVKVDAALPGADGVQDYW